MSGAAPNAETAPPLADLLWLLRGSRLTLDAIAAGRDDPEQAAEHAAAQAQRIVDHLGHATTDEPPHTLVENDRLREALLTAATGIEVIIRGGCDQAQNLKRLADFMHAEATPSGGSSVADPPPLRDDLTPEDRAAVDALNEHLKSVPSGGEGQSP